MSNFTISKQRLREIISEELQTNSFESKSEKITISKPVLQKLVESYLNGDGEETDNIILEIKEVLERF